jgi:hypothetical protein
MSPKRNRSQFAKTDVCASTATEITYDEGGRDGDGWGESFAVAAALFKPSAWR